MAMWTNDALNTELPRARTKPASDYLNFNSDWDSGLESEEEPTGEEPEGERTPQVHIGLCLACPDQMDTRTIYLSQAYKGHFV